MEKTYSRTNIYLIDKDLWKWAKFRADTLGFNSVSEYLFDFIKKDKDDLTFSVTFTQDEYDAILNSSSIFTREGIKDYLIQELDVEEWIERHKEEEDDLSLDDKEDIA